MFKMHHLLQFLLSLLLFLIPLLLPQPVCQYLIPLLPVFYPNQVVLLTGYSQICQQCCKVILRLLVPAHQTILIVDLAPLLHPCQLKDTQSQLRNSTNFTILMMWIVKGWKMLGFGLEMAQTQGLTMIWRRQGSQFLAGSVFIRQTYDSRLILQLACSTHDTLSSTFFVLFVFYWLQQVILEIVCKVLFGTKV